MTDVVVSGGQMLELLNGFIFELREAGLPVSLTENLDAMEAIKHIPIEDRAAFKYALAATLVKNNTHWRAFETVFEVYFRSAAANTPSAMTPAIFPRICSISSSRWPRTATENRVRAPAARHSHPRNWPPCSTRRCARATTP